MSRRKKYGDEMVIKSVYLPKKLVDWIDRERKKRGISMNEYIVSLLMSADVSLAQEIIQYYDEIRKELRRTAERISPTQLFVKMESIEIPAEILQDHEFRNAIQRAKQVLQQGQLMRNVLDWLPNVIEEIALRHGYEIRNKRLLRMTLARMLRQK